MKKTITVTELKFACLDADWRKKWLEGRRPTTRNLCPPGEMPLYGAVFHRIVDGFIDWLIKSRGKKIAQLDSGDALWGELYDRFAAGELAKIARRGNVASAYHLSLALRAFCERAAQIKARTQPFKNWQDVYLAKEYAVKDMHFELGASDLFVSGQLDALRFHPEHGLEVVDYKLTRGRQMQHDLLQLAIYARLLSLSKPGLRFHGTLEYYEPELYPVEIAGQDLESLFEEKVRPVLYEIVGEKSPLPPSETIQSVVPPEPLPKKSKTEAAAKDLSAEIRDCFNSFKLAVEVVGKTDAPQLTRYRVKPAPGVKVVSLANRADDLRVFLSLRQTPLIEPSSGSVIIDIPKVKPDTVFWKDVIADPLIERHQSPVAFPVGVGVDGRLVVADFADPNMCHCLVAGVAGSGKSEYLKSMVTSLIARSRPDTVKLTIIDPKVLTFGGLPADLPHLTGPVINDIQAAIPCLQRAVKDMQKRYRLLAEDGLQNLTERFDNGKSDIPYHVIVFDEFADLIMTGKEEKKEFEQLVVRIAQMGRAAGIHLVLTTQRPDRTVVTGLIKANLPLKICMRVTNSANSSIVLDQTGGEKLLGRGDLLCDRGHGVERAQSPYVTQQELKRLFRN